MSIIINIERDFKDEIIKTDFNKNDVFGEFVVEASKKGEVSRIGIAKYFNSDTITINGVELNKYEFSLLKDLINS